MLTIYANIAPYLSCPRKIKEFLEKHEEMSLKTIVEEIEKELQIVKGPLKTDFQILLNEIRKKGATEKQI